MPCRWHFFPGLKNSGIRCSKHRFPQSCSLVVMPLNPNIIFWLCHILISYCNINSKSLCFQSLYFQSVVFHVLMFPVFGFLCLYVQVPSPRGVYFYIFNIYVLASLHFQSFQSAYLSSLLTWSVCSDHVSGLFIFMPLCFLFPVCILSSVYFSGFILSHLVLWNIIHIW